jgi:hypothetical protein
MPRRAKRRKSDYTFSDSWKIVKPLAAGEVQCKHTTKPWPARLCSMCCGAEVQRVSPIAELPAPEAHPSNPHKRSGC